MNDVLLECENVIKLFPQKRHIITGRVFTTFKAVDNISLAINRKETLGIVGESGSGKSTLGEILGGILMPTEGIVRYKGKDISTMPREEYKIFRKNVQFIFQDPKGSMNTNYRIASAVEEPLITLEIEKDQQKRKKMVRDICNRVGLDESSLNKFPGELSGGQCQRVAIARALITTPEVIICDEAVSALDVSVQAQILNLLKDIQNEFGTSFLFISHDIGVVNFMADRISVIYHGSVVESGPADHILHEPKMDYTKKLLQSTFAKRE